MNDIYESYRHSIDEFVSSLGMTDGQAGAAFAIDGRLAGVEFFDSPNTMARLLPKIVSSYALDAVATSASDRTPRFEAATVEAWFGHLTQVQPTTHPGIGLGEALRWDARGVAAAALTLNGDVLHFVGFPLDDHDGNGSRSQMRSASWRRTNRTQ
jgi:hypothetical protein